MKGILLQIREMLPKFSPAEKNIAEYILCGDWAGLSIGELAQKACVSKAAVVRFSKTLGFEGYRDFAFRLTAEQAVAKDEADDYTDVKIGDGTDAVFRNACRNNIRAIEDSMSLISVERLNAAVKLLTEAKSIDFYGVGVSGIVALDAGYKFMKIGKQCNAYADPHLQLMSAANLGKDCAAVVISWSGETEEALRAAKLAKENGAKLIAVTKCGGNSLSDCADIVFGLSAPEPAIRCGAMSSRIAQCTMIDVLFSCVVGAEYEKLKPILEKSLRAAPKRYCNRRKSGGERKE